MIFLPFLALPRKIFFMALAILLGRYLYNNLSHT
jgi:hypothetical protein